MNHDDQLDRLERLTRLRAAGALSEAEFEREKQRLLPEANPAPTTMAGPRWGRALLVIVSGLALVSGAGWALAGWSEPEAAATDEAQVSAAGVVAAPASPPSAGSALRVLSAARQSELAFEALFGKAAHELSVGEDARFSYDKGRVIWTGFGPVLIAEGNGEPYPPALGTLGIFYLREVPGGRFEVVKRWPDAVSGGSMGNPPQWSLHGDMADGMVIEAKAGGVWQGYACDATSLTELTPDGPRSLANFDSHYDSSGAEGETGQSYDGTITNVVRGRSFDVRFRGTRAFTQHFVRKGKTFVRVPSPNEEMGESTVPTC